MRWKQNHYHVTHNLNPLKIMFAYFRQDTVNRFFHHPFKKKTVSPCVIKLGKACSFKNNNNNYNNRSAKTLYVSLLRLLIDCLKTLPHISNCQRSNSRVSGASPGISNGCFKVQSMGHVEILFWKRASCTDFARYIRWVTGNLLTCVERYKESKICSAANKNIFVHMSVIKESRAISFCIFLCLRC